MLDLEGVVEELLPPLGSWSFGSLANVEERRVLGVAVGCCCMVTWTNSSLTVKEASAVAGCIGSSICSGGGGGGGGSLAHRPLNAHEDPSKPVHDYSSERQDASQRRDRDAKTVRSS